MTLRCAGRPLTTEQHWLGLLQRRELARGAHRGRAVVPTSPARGPAVLELSGASSSLQSPSLPPFLSEPVELGFGRLLPKVLTDLGPPVGASREWKLARSSGGSPACLPSQLPHRALRSRSSGHASWLLPPHTATPGRRGLLRLHSVGARRSCARVAAKGEPSAAVKLHACSWACY